MLHIQVFENYAELDRGKFNKAFDLGDGWILKSPLDRNETAYLNKTTKGILADFKRHIKFMSKFPEFFAEVKLLNKYRAVQEKLDLEQSKKEIVYLHKVLGKGPFEYLEDDVDNVGLIQYLYHSTDELEWLEEYLNTNPSDAITNKWYKFIMALKSKFGNMPLDLHWDNMGIDKNGNIKLLDF